MTLEEIIKNLIETKKEGDYWDFKVQHHQNNVDLIKDIICLANTMNHSGERYLIFGVADDFLIKGIKDRDEKKTQENIITLLKDARFAGERFPNVRLENIDIDGKTLDILIIQDQFEKPYFLIEDKKDKKDKKDKGKYIRAGTIYSRIRDVNTAQNKVAPLSEIEKMWKERFGLFLSPLDRVKKYLSDFGNWDTAGDVDYYYKPFPEFTIKINNSDDDLEDEDESIFEWNQGEIITDGNTSYYAEVYYHQTLLKKIQVVIFDDRKKSMVAPSWDPINKGRMYFYLEDSVEYSYQKYWSNYERQDHSKTLSKRLENWGKGNRIFSIPVFQNIEDKENFIKENHDLEKTIDPESNEEKQMEIFYNIIDIYNKWRNME